MKLKTHLELAKQWDITLTKIDPQEDHIALIEICMMMGTTLMNAVFHKRSIREEQFDQNHTHRPPIPEEAEAKITPDVREMMNDLLYIEQMRSLHCRGITGGIADGRELPEWDSAVSVTCLANIRKMQAFTEQVMRE